LKTLLRNGAVSVKINYHSSISEKALPHTKVNPETIMTLEAHMPPEQETKNKDSAKPNPGETNLS
jgi:hypothetical protein